jgi:hypothetical protein
VGKYFPGRKEDSRGKKKMAHFNSALEGLLEEGQQ